jgi:ribosomal protein S18 acetylase RimI-like enzyme
LFKQLKIRSNQVYETMRSGGFKALVRKTFYWNREIVFVEKNLSVYDLKSKPEEKDSLQFIEIAEQATGNKLLYPLKSRQIKIKKNLAKGYGSFAVIRNMEVLGDVWYVHNDYSMKNCKHPDLKWLGLRLTPKEVYMFDMYTDPNKRGKGLVNYLFSCCLQELKKRGFQKVYGYYEVDNLPALWMHRTMGFKENQRIKLKKFFSFIKATVMNSSI